MVEPARKWIGQSLPRKEDRRFLTGRGTYADDVVLSGMLHAAFVRSPHAHARIRSIDFSAALELEGVHGLITGDEMRKRVAPTRGREFPRGGECFFLAVDKVRWEGEPVVLIAAETRHIAEDACDLVRVEYEPLSPILIPKEALRDDAPLVHEQSETNVAIEGTLRYGDTASAFASADATIFGSYIFERYVTTPIEPARTVAHWDATDNEVSLWTQSNTQGPLMLELPQILGIPTNKLRLFIPDVGGHFGTKAFSWRYSVPLTILSKDVGRPIKWTEDRIENLIGQGHGRNQECDVEIAVKKNGLILGIRMQLLDDLGAYIIWPEPRTAGSIRNAGILGCYRFQNAEIVYKGLMTTKCPVVPSRGYGKPQHYFFLEKAIDHVALELGLDPIEIRRKNLIRASDMPYTFPNGTVLDNGDPPEMLRLLAEKIEYQNFRRLQVDLRKKGRFQGVGIAICLEGGGSNIPDLGRAVGQKSGGAAEASGIRLQPDGSVRVQIPSGPHGQGHETVASQIVADVLGVDPDSVNVECRFDSASMPFTATTGTYGNSFAVLAAPAVHAVAVKLRNQLAQMAGHLLECSPDDLEFIDGTVSAKGVCDFGVSMSELAKVAYFAPDAFFGKHDSGLSATHVWSSPAADAHDSAGNYRSKLSHAPLAQAAVVEVNASTGLVTVLRYVVIEDCGTALNPAVVDGQIRGGILNGIGGVLFERLQHDENGRLLTRSFREYPIPKFTEGISVEIHHVGAPYPHSPLGAKGIGDGSIIPVHAVLANAIEDALKPMNARIHQAHLDPESVVKMLDFPSIHRI